MLSIYSWNHMNLTFEVIKMLWNTHTHSTREIKYFLIFSYLLNVALAVVIIIHRLHFSTFISQCNACFIIQSVTYKRFIFSFCSNKLNDLWFCIWVSVYFLSSQHHIFNGTRELSFFLLLYLNQKGMQIC